MSRHESTVPRVSVIIPTYNWAPVLPYAMGSVLDQTLTDFELLVVGDGCTDESEETVKSVRDPRVRWINLPRNTGHQSGPNNEGQRRARGDIVAYLGHDDLWLPNHLDLLVQKIDSGAAAAHTSMLHVDPVHPPRVAPPHGWRYRPGAWIPPTSLALTREILLHVGGWRHPSRTGRLDPESELLARVSNAAGPPAWVDRVTCVKLSAARRKDVYRIRPNAEQAHWLQMIRDADDPERELLATVDAFGEAGIDSKPKHVRFATRVWRSARYRTRRFLGLESAAWRYRRSRRYKGL